MEFLKALFESGQLDWDSFSKAVTEKGYKLADLSKGDYVSKRKYDDDIKDRDDQLTNLNSTISTRDTDLKALQEQLDNAKGDSAQLKKVKEELTNLQSTYAKDKEDYDKQIKAQKYEYAVRDFANGQKFTSNAAKNEFIRTMKEKNLQMEDNTILGATDYLAKYKEENADSFVVETEPKTEPTKPLPKFADKTSGPNAKTEPNNPFINAMHFTEVHPHKE